MGQERRFIDEHWHPMTYSSGGTRSFLKDPQPIRIRSNWSMLCCADACIAPITPNGLLAPPQPGIWLMPPGLPHNWHAKQDNITIVGFHFRRIPPFLQAIGYPGSPPDFKGSYLPCSFSLFEHLQGLHLQAGQWLGSQDPRAGIHIQALTWRCFALLSDAVSNPAPQHNAGQHHVDKACAWFVSHMHEGVGVREMAAAMHYSPAHLRRLFHEATGQSPRQHCETLRMDRACELLQRGMSCAQVAKLVGYASDAAFNRIFQRLMQRTPGQWQQQITR